MLICSKKRKMCVLTVFSFSHIPSFSIPPMPPCSSLILPLILFSLFLLFSEAAVGKGKRFEKDDEGILLDLPVATTRRPPVRSTYIPPGHYAACPSSWCLDFNWSLDLCVKIAPSKISRCYNKWCLENFGAESYCNWAKSKASDRQCQGTTTPCQCADPLLVQTSVPAVAVPDGELPSVEGYARTQRCRYDPGATGNGYVSDVPEGQYKLCPEGSCLDHKWHPDNTTCLNVSAFDLSECWTNNCKLKVGRHSFCKSDKQWDEIHCLGGVGCECPSINVKLEEAVLLPVDQSKQGWSEAELCSYTPKKRSFAGRASTTSGSCGCLTLQRPVYFFLLFLTFLQLLSF